MANPRPETTEVHEEHHKTVDQRAGERANRPQWPLWARLSSAAVVLGGVFTVGFFTGARRANKKNARMQAAEQAAGISPMAAARK